MNTHRRVSLAALVVAAGVCVGWQESPTPAATAEGRPPETPEHVAAGRKTYEHRCVGCHGIDGDGDGLAADYLSPPPRDFTDVEYKLRTTASGARPRIEDVFRTVTRGVPGTAMASWEEVLTAEQRWQVVYYLTSFAAEDFAEELEADDLINAPHATGPATEAQLARGKKLFDVLKCWECHGHGGRGNGPSVRTLKDTIDDNPIWPANLHRPDLFRGGGDVNDIARAFLTGLDTTPMPSYIDSFQAYADKTDLPADQQILHVPVAENALSLAHYVKSLGTGAKARREEQQFVAEYTAGAIPEDPDAPEWARATGVILRLSAQITLPPRWQFASVDRLFVDALYNDTEIGVLVQWDDRTEDRKHGADDYEFQRDEPSVVMSTRADLAELRQRPFADALAIQFPAALGEGATRPFFALGAPDAPVESWEFRAGRGGERSARTGFYAPPADPRPFVAKARYDDGRWRVVFKIPRGTDSRFTPGTYLPVAFAAWDGGNGEAGTRCGISSWYWFLLKPQASAAPYLYALLALILVGLGEFWLIRYLKRCAGAPADAPISA